MWKLGEGGDTPEWREVETPFGKTLFGVAQTTQGPYAVGSGGTLVADRGEGWEIIFDDGPNTRNNQLRAMDVTDDGERIWMLGSSGAMACYDVEQRKKFDYSYPNEMTSTWEGITVCGDRGKEKILAANGSGEVLPFVLDGFDVDWGQLDKPAGKGSNVAALAATPSGVGFAIDTSGNAFKTTAESGWEDIGIVNAQVKFYDVYAGPNQRVYIAAGDGRIYRYDDSYHNWTPIGVTEKTSLQSIDVYKGEAGRQMVVLGNDGSIYQRTGPERWEQIPSPTNSALYSLRLGDERDVAVGKNGTVIERPRGEPRNAGSSADGDSFDGRGETYDGDANDPHDPHDSGADDPDTDPEDDADGESSDPEDADDDEDPDSREGGEAGAAGWNAPEGPADANGSARADADATEQADGAASAPASADAETKEAVLVTLAERTDLESADIELAAENGSSVIEAVLTDIAEEVGIDPERVRAALRRPAE